MLIISQDRKTILDMLGCRLFVTKENHILGYGNDSSNDDSLIFLGEYLTEERAIEVLDEICNAYLNLNIDHFCDYGYVKNGVYQMPEV